MLEQPKQRRVVQNWHHNTLLLSFFKRGYVLSWGHDFIVSVHIIYFKSSCVKMLLLGKSGNVNQQIREDENSAIEKGKKVSLKAKILK